jgi:hypothetical protein
MGVMLVTESQQIRNARPRPSSQTIKLLWPFVSEIGCTRFPSEMIILDDGLPNNLSSRNSRIKRAVAQALPDNPLAFEVEIFLELQFQVRRVIPRRRAVTLVSFLFPPVSFNDCRIICFSMAFRRVSQVGL